MSMPSGSVAALFPSNLAGKWTRLLRPENQAELTFHLPSNLDVGPNKPLGLRLACRPLDHFGRPLTNALFHIVIGNLNGDVNSGAGALAVAANVTRREVPISVSLISSNPFPGAPISLSDIQVAVNTETKK
jgi:hypothetical protein